MVFFGKTHIGNVREENQDNFSIVEYDGAVCLTVCDGMGGANGGRIASETAIDGFNKHISQKLQEVSFDSPEVISKTLEEAVFYAHEAVKAKARENEELEGMGTTLVSAFVTKNGAYVVNVGDSRCYRLSDGVLSKITKDHSLVQSMVDSGMLTEEEAENHPQKNCITRAIGVDYDMKPDLFYVAKFDGLLLCSDGLTNMVSCDEIKSIVLDTINPEDAVCLLIDRALEQGGLDNITVALIKEEV